MASHSDWVSGLQQVRLSPWGQGALATEHTAGVCPNQPGFPGSSVVKNLLANAGDVGLIPAMARSPGEGNGNPLQYSCLGNPMDRGAWQDTVHGVAKEQLNNNRFRGRQFFYGQGWLQMIPVHYIYCVLLFPI